MMSYNSGLQHQLGDVKLNSDNSEQLEGVMFMAFGIAIGYASNFVPEQPLLSLAMGLSLCAVVYLVLAWRDHDWNVWKKSGLQTMALALGAIASSTSKLLSAAWAIFFITIGCIAFILSISLRHRKRRAGKQRVSKFRTMTDQKRRSRASRIAHTKRAPSGL